MSVWSRLLLRDMRLAQPTQALLLGGRRSLWNFQSEALLSRSDVYLHPRSSHDRSLLLSRLQHVTAVVTPVAA